MTPADRWRRVEELCHAALDREPNERSAFLLTACGSDDALREEIEGLLIHASTAEQFLAEPAHLVGDTLTRETRSMVGRHVAHYSIVEQLGAGGMGVVYRAEDTKLRRSVALKFLPPDLTRDGDAKRRFMLEAQAASALEHQNICTIHEIGETLDGQLFLAMAYYAGDTLKTQIERGPLALDAAVGYATQIAEGLVKAHAAGIVHRDIKPANVLVTGDGVVKIVDFGIAKLLGQTSVTRTGTTLGTCVYMSPEQHAGLPVDARTDVWSLGVVLYEMVSGRLPFGGEHPHAVALAVAHARQTPLTALRADVPIALERIVTRALAKRPDDRYQTAGALLADLQQLQRALNAPRATMSRPIRTRAVASAVIAIVMVTVVFGWLWRRSSRERWALEIATPEITRLVDAEEFAKAAVLSREARVILPKNPSLEKLWMRSTVEASVDSVPSGADVAIQPYGDNTSAWQDLGETPLKNIRVPRGIYVWRIAKVGFASASFIDGIVAPMQPGLHADIGGMVKLRPEATVPANMVTVQEGETRLGYPVAQPTRFHVDDYLIDRYEVTNEEYQTFVDAGGYQRRELWKQPFVRDGRTISWDEAVNLFRDATGRAGPATWEVGHYPKGLEKHPVAGVSWYEAAAYAEFVGKSLPTVYHWTNASQADVGGTITRESNFHSAGTQSVGGRGAMSGFGTTDMAGNVKEWCWNEGRDGKRFILGGGFGEPTYMFNLTDEQSPWARRPNYGFRCVKLDSPASAAATAKIEPTSRDYWNDKPVSNDVFKAYEGLYAYDPRPLNARVEETETTANFVREKVSFDAAYGNERVIAHLFLPRSISPPFQVVVYFPGADALLDQKVDLPNIVDSLDYLLRSGRALLFPIYKGTYERRDGLVPGGKPPAMFRDHMIMWSKDLGRALDYLQDRKDIDSAKMAYSGFSLGVNVAPILLAVEKRFKAAILTVGGFQLRYDLPEADALNFAPRVKTPVLMLNGRYDEQFPLELSPRPLFHFLGTPDQDKKHIIYEASHGDLPHREEVRETLDWLDKYLGPVRR